MKVENRDSSNNKGCAKKRKYENQKHEVPQISESNFKVNEKKRDRRTYIEKERFVGRVERQATPEVYAPNQNQNNGRNC